MISRSPVVVAVLLRPGGRPRRRPRAPAAGENAEVGPPEGRVAQRVQHLKARKWNKIKGETGARVVVENGVLSLGTGWLENTLGGGGGEVCEMSQNVNVASSAVLMVLVVKKQKSI